MDDAFYLISELVHGETLASLISARTLADERVFEIGIALTAALSHAHSRGVIHRDVKPQNVLIPHLLGDPSARRCGQADRLRRARLAGEDVLTRTGDVLGTFAYMAPEQSDGGQVGEAADLYSLALVLYEALSGINPVRGRPPPPPWCGGSAAASSRWSAAGAICRARHARSTGPPRHLSSDRGRWRASSRLGRGAAGRGGRPTRTPPPGERARANWCRGDRASPVGGRSTAPTRLHAPL